jgi:AcrR family transcriptional regulator
VVDITDAAPDSVAPVPTRREERRREIQSLAAALFNVRGYDAVSVRDLAEAAQVSQPTLYWYIGSKQELLMAIHESLIKDLTERFSRVAASGWNADVKLRALVHEGCVLKTQRWDESTVYWRERRRLSAEFSQAQIPKYERVDQVVKDVLAEGVSSSLWPETNVLAARMAFWSIVTFFTEWFKKDGPLTVDEIADQFANFILAGLKAESADVTAIERGYRAHVVN